MKKKFGDIVMREGFSFLTLCQYWQKIEQTSKRLEKIMYLFKLFLHIHIKYSQDLPRLLLLSQNIIREPWEPGPSALNMGE